MAPGLENIQNHEPSLPGSRGSELAKNRNFSPGILSINGRWNSFIIIVHLLRSRPVGIDRRFARKWLKISSPSVHLGRVDHLVNRKS
jgi:hypothetical protein